MAGVLAEAGKVWLKSPVTGEVMQIPEGEAAEALRLGFEPMESRELTQHKLSTWYGSPEMQAGAVGLGLVRGITGGLSDVLVPEGSEHVIQSVQEANPALTVGGDIAGTALGLAATGGIAGAGKLGAGAAGLAGRALGREATSAIPRLAGAVVREGAVGAGMGLGAGVSEVALSEKPMTPSEVASTLAARAGLGAAVGGGAGALGWAIEAPIKYVKGRQAIQANTKSLKQLHTEKAAALGEVETLKASSAPKWMMGKAQQRLDRINTALAQQQTGLAGRLFGKAAAFGAARSMGGMSGGLLRSLVPDRAIQAVKNVVMPGVEMGAKAASQATRAVTPTAKAVASVLPDEPPMVFPEDITEDNENKLRGAMVRKLQPDKGLEEALARLDPEDLKAVSEQIGEMDPQGVHTTLLAMLPENMPPAIKEGIGERVLGVIEFLKEAQPEQADGGRIGGDRREADPLAAIRYERTLKAILHPASVTEAFVKEELRDEHVKAWREVFPEALDQLQAMVRAGVAMTVRAGAQIGKSRAAQVATVLEDKSLAPRMYDPAHVARIQAMHQAVKEKPGPKPRARQMSLARRHETTSQRLRRGL